MMWLRWRRIRILVWLVVGSIASVAYGFLSVPPSWTAAPLQTLLRPPSVIDTNTIARLASRGIIKPLFMTIKSSELEKKNKKNEEDEEGQGFGRFMGGFFQGDNRDETPEGTTLEDDDDESKNGILQSVVKRFGFRKEPDKEDGSNSGPRPEDEESIKDKILRKLPFTNKKEETVFPENTERKMNFPNPWETIEESLINARKQVSSVRASEALPQDVEEKRLAELRKQMEANRQRQRDIMEQKKRDDEAQQLAKKEAQNLAIEIAKLETEQRLERARKQREQYQRRKAVLEAASTGKKSPSLTRTVPVPSKPLQAQQQQQPEATVKRTNEPIKPAIEATRERKNPSSIAQQFFAEKKTSDADSEKRPQPWALAQKVASGIWESTFGGSGNEEEWVVVIPKTRMAPGQIVPVQVGGIDLLVIASIDGTKLHCLANSCPHLGTPLETGLLRRRPVPVPKGSSSSGSASATVRNETSSSCEEDCIVCPLHHTAFALESGEVRGEWCPYPPMIGAMMGAVKAKSPVAVFDIRTRGKNIEVRINSSIDDRGQKGPRRKQSG